MAGDPVRKWFGGRGRVSCLAPVTLQDGKYSHQAVIASGGDDGVIRVWDVVSDEPPFASFTAHAGHVTALAQATMSGRQFTISVGTDNYVRSWDIESTRHPVWELETPQSPKAITAVTLPDGEELIAAAGGEDYGGWLRIWDPQSGKVAIDMQTPPIEALASARLPDEKTVLAGCGFGPAPYGSSDATLWHVTADLEFTAPSEYSLRGGDLDFIRLSDGRIFIMTSGALVDPQDGKQLHFSLPSLVWSISAVRLPDGKQIAALGGPYGEISFIDVDLRLEEYASERQRDPVADTTGASRSELGVVNEHEFYVIALASVPDPRGSGDLIVSGGQDGTLRVWEPSSRACLHEPVTGHAGRITALTTVNNGTDHALLVSGDATGTVWCWDPETGKREAGPLSGHVDIGGGVLALAPDPTMPDAVLVGGGNARLVTWHDIRGDLPKQSVIAQDQGSIYGGINRVTVVPSPAQEPLIAMTAESGHVRLWKYDRGVWNELFPDTSDPHLPGSKEIVALPQGTDTIVAYTRGREVWLRRLSDWSNPQPFETDEVGSPLTLASVEVSGMPLLAYGYLGGFVALYDVTSGDQVCSIDTKNGSITAMTAWRAPDGATFLACGHDTGEITTWNVPAGAPDRWVHAHHGRVTALTTISRDGDTPQLASGGSDGLICLWDPSTAGVDAYEAAGIATTGFSDQPSPRDLLGRTAIVDVVAEILMNPEHPESSRESLEEGPTVIAIDGPWGSGKTTLMGLIYDKIKENIPVSAPSSPRPLSPAAAQRLLRERSEYRGQAEPLITPGERRGLRVLPGWFDPWVHQSGEQLWAGLARTVIDAADEALLPNVNSRHRYWFAHNTRRIDPQLVRRRIWLRVTSPVLSAAGVTVLIPVILQLVLKSSDKTTRIADLFGYPVTPLALAIALPLVLAVVGAAHTLTRYFFGNAINYLDAELFQGPLPTNQEHQGLLRDPMYQADSGYLYLVQHDIDGVLDDLRRAGYRLVVFIDDLDRCAPPTTVAMLEAMNLFLSGTLPRARFVMGLDSAVTAAHIDAAYEKSSNPATLHTGDPSIGWTFLRKLIQLPIPIPAMSENAIDRLVEGALGARTMLAPADWSGTRRPWVARQVERHAEWRPQSAPKSGVEAPTLTLGTATAPPLHLLSPPPLEPLPPASMYRKDTGQRWIWSLQVLEDSPRVRSTLQSRLNAQPDLTPREGKRLITVWQYCVRLMDRWHPMPAAATLERAQALILVAEIITRWPSCMAKFRKIFTDNSQGDTLRTGLQLLAVCADDNDAWHAALHDIGLDKLTDIVAIRQLLIHPQAGPATELFTQLILGTDPAALNPSNTQDSRI